jgi:hypothetical protein
VKATVLAAAVAADGPVSVVGRVTPDTTTIGSPVRYEVEVRARYGVEVLLAQPTERLGVFEILDFGERPVRVAGDVVVTTRWFDLVGYEVGHHLVESPPVSYRVAGEPLTPQEGGHPFLDRCTAKDVRVAEADEAGAFGLRVGTRLEHDLTKLIGRPAGCAHLHLPRRCLEMSGR